MQVSHYHWKIRGHFLSWGKPGNFEIRLDIREMSGKYAENGKRLPTVHTQTKAYARGRKGNCLPTKFCQWEINLIWVRGLQH